MSDSELCFTPATELVDAIRAKKVSAVEITTAVLDRISRLEPRLNAFAYLAAAEAIDSAQAADRTLANGQFVGPLHGVPVTIKDHEAVRGMQIEYGTHLRRGDVAQADNAMVSRLRHAGTIILGKTATPEFGWMGVQGRPARRLADRRTSLRRSRRAADVRRLRGGASLGVPASASRLRGAVLGPITPADSTGATTYGAHTPGGSAS